MGEIQKVYTQKEVDDLLQEQGEEILQIVSDFDLRPGEEIYPKIKEYLSKKGEKKWGNL